MPRQDMVLTNPIDRGDGLTQTKLMVNYVYVSDTEFTFHSVQGNIISVPYDVNLQNLLIALEDAAKAIIDVP